MFNKYDNNLKDLCDWFTEQGQQLQSQLKEETNTMAFEKKDWKNKDKGAAPGAKGAEAPVKKKNDPNSELPPSAFVMGKITSVEEAGDTGRRVKIEISAFCGEKEVEFLDGLKGETDVIAFLALPFGSKDPTKRYVKLNKIALPREASEG